MADETKSYAEARLGEETTVLVVGNLPDLPRLVRDVRVAMGWNIDVLRPEHWEQPLSFQRSAQQSRLSRLPIARYQLAGTAGHSSVSLRPID